MLDFVYPTVPALAGSGFEAPAGLGVPAFAGVAPRPVPHALAAQARPRFGKGAELLDEGAAASRIAARVAAVADDLRPRLDALAADLAAAGRLADDARKLAKRPDDTAVAAIAAHSGLVAGMVARHEAAPPPAVERVRRLARIDPVEAPLAHHQSVRQALADLARIEAEIADGLAELAAAGRRLEELREGAAAARAGTVADLQARLAAAEARARDRGEVAGLHARVAALGEEIGRLLAARAAG